MKRALCMLLVLMLCLTLLPLSALAGDLSGMLTQGDAALAAGDFGTAEICYDIAHQLDAADIRALLGLAAAREGQGDMEGAMAYASMAVDASPASAAGYAARAALYAKKGDAKSAWKDMQYAAVCPDQQLPDTLYADVGALLYAAEDAQNAVLAFQKAGELALTDAYAKTYRRALVAMGQRDTAEALGLIKPGARDEALEMAFEGGSEIRIERVPLAFDGCEMYVPTFYLAQNEEFAANVPVSGMTADGTRAMVGVFDGAALNMELSPLDISPDGEQMIVSGGDNLFVYRSGELTLIVPNYSRGVPDAYRKLEYLLAATLKGQIGPQGFVWSENGRYALLLNGEEALVHLHLRYDLFILDTDTGEMFLGYTLPNKILEGGGTVVNATFAENDQAIYFSLLGGAYNDRYSLMRYDMETGETKLLLNHPQSLYRTGLFVDADGRVSCPSNTHQADEKNGLLLYAQENGRWRLTEKQFPFAGNAITPLKYRLSAKNGYGIYLLNVPGTLDKGCYGLMRVNANADYAGLSEMLYFPNGAESASTLELTEDLTGREQLLALYQTLTQDARVPFNAVLSPDGRYALLLLKDMGAAKGGYSFCLMDMETLALRAVQTPEGLCDVSGVYQTTQSMRYERGRGYGWFEDNRLIICTAEGIVLCRLTWA